MYLRRPIKKIFDNRKINYLSELYESYNKAIDRDEKLKSFEEIARNRSLSNDLIGGLYFDSPSYTDFGDERKIHRTYIMLIEQFDYNIYWVKKYLHPKYVIKDLLFMPAAIFSFLLNHEFNKVPSFLVSCITWIATILISAYATEIRLLIDELIKNSPK